MLGFPTRVDVLKVTVTLTDEQIRGLADVGVDIIPAPGAGKISVPLFGFAYLHHVADYTGGNFTEIYFANDVDGDFDQVSGSGLFPSLIGPDGWTIIPAYGYVPASANIAVVQALNYLSAANGTWDNKPIQVWANGTALTGGDGNTMDVTALYAVIDINA